MRIVVTGGAGFIGSAVCRFLIGQTEHDVCNVDKLTYAGNLNSLRDVSGNNRYRFVQADICDREAIERVFADFAPHAVIHLAAESHVDRSIEASSEFIDTNIVGTLNLLEASRRHLARDNARAQTRSASSMFRPTKYTDRWDPRAGSLRRPPTVRTRPMQPARHPPIIWRAHGTRPMASRPSSRTARTTTVPITSRKN